MTRVHPAFSNLTGAEAVAFSEPLCRTDEFQMYHDGRFEDISRPLGGVAAIGAAHNNGKDTAFNFALRANNDRPLATAKAFVDEYHEIVTKLRGRAVGDPYAAHNSDQARRTIIETARLYGLRTIAALLLFRTAEDASAHTTMLVVPRNVMVEAGSAIAALGTKPNGRTRDVPTAVGKELGFLAGITQLPSFPGAREVVDRHPDVAGFLHLKRGPRRGRLKAEAREARKAAESKK